MGADGRGGFQPCALDTGSGSAAPSWERNLVVGALVVHIIDVGLDLLVVLLFLVYLQWGFFFGTAGVIVWAWLVSSLYVSFGAGSPGAGDIDDGGLADRLPQFFLSFVQWQIFAEAYRCVFRGGDTDYFHTLRLMEAILESAPNSLVQLYALITWAGTDNTPEGAASLLRISAFASFVSVGLGLAMWEQKVQVRTSSMYVAAVALMRAFEIASRALTLAVFAGLTHPYGLWWALLIDYGVMLILIVRHQSVQFTYGLFVALPLVLVSLEPLVWQREDHAVPKDLYYMVRIIEFVLMWIYIIFKQDKVYHHIAQNSSWEGCEALALLSTLGLYVMLLFVWRSARRHELSRDVTDWAEDGSREGLHADGAYSDSDVSSDGSDKPEAAGNPDELPPE